MGTRRKSLLLAWRVGVMGARTATKLGGGGVTSIGESGGGGFREVGLSTEKFGNWKPGNRTSNI